MGCSFVFQTSPSKFSIPFNGQTSHIEIDGFGNIYAINTNEIIKYNPAGILQKKFSSKRYGKIEYVDVMNPLKLLVYYKDFQQIIFLDNQMTESSAVLSLESMGYEQSSLVCSSSNNGLWLFDKQNNELTRFNSELKNIVKTGNLKRILDVNLKPNFMREHNNYLYLNCPNEGILVFDIYGTFYKTIPIKNLKEFNIINGDVMYFENKTLKQYITTTFNILEKPFSDTLIQQVLWQHNRFYIVYNDSLIAN